MKRACPESGLPQVIFVLPFTSSFISWPAQCRANSRRAGDVCGFLRTLSSPTYTSQPVSPPLPALPMDQRTLQDSHPASPMSTPGWIIEAKGITDPFDAQSPLKGLTASSLFSLPPPLPPLRQGPSSDPHLQEPAEGALNPGAVGGGCTGVGEVGGGEGAEKCCLTAAEAAGPGPVPARLSCPALSNSLITAPPPPVPTPTPTTTSKPVMPQFH